MGGFFEGSLEYRSYIGEDEDYNAIYRTYNIYGAMVREIFSLDEEAVEGSAVIVYYFPARSKCVGADGSCTTFPRPKSGDICVFRVGQDDERIMRVAEIGYFTGTGKSTHIRLKLK